MDKKIIKNKAWRQDAYHTKLREKKMKCQQGKWRLSGEEGGQYLKMLPKDVDEET